jgi:hypothetical protein
MSKTQCSGLTGFDGTEAGADLNTGPKESPQPPTNQSDVWQKLRETDGCLGSWNKETGEWIPLIR